MSISTEITRINGNIADAYTAVSGKGGILPATRNSANLPAAIDSIPTGQVEAGPLCFTAKQANSTVRMSVSGTPTKGQSFEYSTNGETWSAFVPGTTVVTLANIGSKVFFRGNNTTVSESNVSYRFAMTGTIAASGNIMSLLDKSLAKTDVPAYCFKKLFMDCTSLVSAPVLPATTLGDRCYYSMFYGCSSLTTPPVLPAITMASDCYGFLFYNCTSLATAPELPALTMAEMCYEYMFYGCSSLALPPSLPATILARRCYGGMFQGCTSLSALPILPATELVTDCYEDMFRGCTGIKLATALTPSYRTQYRIPSNGTGEAVTNAMADMFTGTGGTFTGTPNINTKYYSENQIVGSRTLSIETKRLATIYQINGDTHWQTPNTILQKSLSDNDDIAISVTPAYDTEYPTLTENGEYSPGRFGVEFFSGVKVDVPQTPTQSKTLTLGASAPATVTPDSGKVLSSVPVVLDTSVIKAESIKKDVNILGITGTYEGSGGGGSKQVLEISEIGGDYSEGTPTLVFHLSTPFSVTPTTLKKLIFINDSMDETMIMLFDGFFWWYKEPHGTVEDVTADFQAATLTFREDEIRISGDIIAQYVTSELSLTACSIAVVE